MYIKYTPLLTALLLISSFNASALQLGGIPVNAYPEANDDSISLVAGVYTLAEGNVSSNDRYGTTYTLNDSWVGKYGLITSFDSDGEYTYALFEGTTNASLPPGGIGIDTFRYTLANESGQTDSAQLTIDIRANPNPSQSPIAADDHESVVISEKPSAIGNVSANDLYGSIVSFNQSTGQYGFLTLLDSSGSYIYTLFEGTDNASLAPTGVGTDSFTYTYTNNVGLSDTAQLIINVSANPNPSQSPIAVDDHGSVVIDEKPSATGNVSDNDLYGNTVSFNQSIGQYGFLTLPDSSGGYIYTLFEGTDNASLAPEGVGTDSFTYTYTNNVGLSDTALLTINVSANITQSPLANDDHGSVVIGVKPNATGNVTTNDFNGEIVTFSESLSGQYGFLTVTDSKGDYIYQLFDSTDSASLPSGGVGIDSFTYTLANASGETDTAKLIIDIKVTQAGQPIANDDHISLVAGVYVLAEGNVSSNDLYGTIYTVNGSWVGQYGAITSFDSAGEYTYELFEGTDNASLPPSGVGIDSFTYTLANETGLTDTAQLIIDISANSTHPIANDDHESVVISEKPSATGNVSDNDLYGSIVLFNQSSGEYGFLTVTGSSGSYKYTLFENISLPSSGTDTDSFTYSYANAEGLTDTAKLTIKVSAHKTPAPIANNDHKSVVIDEKPTVVGNVTTNDFNGETVFFEGSASGQYGFLTLTDSSGGYIYKLYEGTDYNSLPSGGVGTDSFTYTLANASGEKDTAKLIIDVTASRVNEPIANDDYISTVVNVYTSAFGNVGANDLFGTTFSLDESWIGLYGAVTSFDSAGEYTYELFESTDNASLPASGVGIDRFTYTYANETGVTDTAQLIIDVNPDPNGDPTSPGGPNTPIARDDNVTAIPNKINPVSGDLTANDSNGDYVQLISSPSSQYGALVLDSDSRGEYVYSLYEDSLNVINIKTGEVVNDVFEYQYFANSGESSSAKLTVQIIGNQEDTEIPPPDDTEYDNVDVEFNNRSKDATPLNSNRNIKGHLYDSEDKDWFYLTSTGDEIITLEVCPQGTSCFGKKSWVLYVFDSEKLTETMELSEFQFSRWLKETNSTSDGSGQQLVNGDAGLSNHMYLAYNQGYFEGALIGVVDPCFDTLNSVEIGVGPGPRNYLIAISSPLLGDTKVAGKDACGSGSVILEKEAGTTTGTDIKGEPASYTIIEQFITAFPYSDDQYAIKITGTGLEPLNSTTAVARSTKYNPFNGDLNIPTVRVGGETYQADLKQEESSPNSPIKFILADIKHLSLEEIVDTYRATYNFENEQVMIPRVTVTNTGKGYSVILQLHTSDDGKKTWFEVVNIKEINKN